MSGKDTKLKSLKSWVDYSYGKDETGQPIRTKREYYADGSLREESIYDSEERRLKRTVYREYDGGFHLRDMGKNYDDRDRLIQYTDYQDKEWYIYIYTEVGDLGEDYPYDRIKVR